MVLMHPHTRKSMHIGLRVVHTCEVGENNCDNNSNSSHLDLKPPVIVTGCRKNVLAQTSVDIKELLLFHRWEWILSLSRTGCYKVGQCFICSGSCCVMLSAVSQQWETFAKCDHPALNSPVSSNMS